MRKTILAIVLFVVLISCLWSQEGAVTNNVEQLQVQLKAANERIAQLEERVKLMTMQQQGAVQFFTAGQALCELDKKQPSPAKTDAK